MADQHSKTPAVASMNAVPRRELDRAAKLLEESIEALEYRLAVLQRDGVKRSPAVSCFERFGRMSRPNRTIDRGNMYGFGSSPSPG